jgi:hypothetical protein
VDETGVLGEKHPPQVADKPEYSEENTHRKALTKPEYSEENTHRKSLTNFIA